jgi:hypothetical protein
MAAKIPGAWMAACLVAAASIDAQTFAQERPDCPGKIICPLTGEPVCKDRCPLGTTSGPAKGSCCAPQLGAVALGVLASTKRDEPVSLRGSLQPLIDHFNEGRGKPRFVALISATCPACVFGAKSIRASILEAYPDADLRVSIVWIDMLPTDNEAAAQRSAAIFDDPRVKQFHDPDRAAGLAIADGLLFAGAGPAWDIYLYYDLDAEWTNRPPKPAEWFHQLSGGRRADPQRFRPGPKLTEALGKATGRIVETPRLQILSFEGCPNAEALRANLAAALDRLALSCPVRNVDLRELSQDDTRRCWGSPTVLLDGVDLMGESRPTQRGLSCRIYAGGKPPGVDEIANRLMISVPKGDTDR